MDKINENTHEKDAVKLDDINYYPILLAAFIGFILVALFLFLRRRVSSRSDFLLMGLCESGKSAIFMQLVYNKFAATLTSMNENVGEYKAGRLSCRLIDLPGHYRIRDKCFNQYKQRAKGIIFVVDAATIQKEIRDVADVLYSILTDSSTLPSSVLVLCNKQDLTTAKREHVIRTMLEKELNVIRETRSHKLQTVGDDESSKSVYLGKEGRNFEFTDIPQDIQFYESSAKEAELANLTDWIDRKL